MADNCLLRFDREINSGQDLERLNQWSSMSTASSYLFKKGPTGLGIECTQLIESCQLPFEIDFN